MYLPTYLRIVIRKENEVNRVYISKRWNGKKAPNKNKISLNNDALQYEIYKRSF